MPEMVRQLVGVSIVLATLVALLWFAKGRGWARWRSFRGAGDERIVTVLQRVPLTPQHTLHVLAVGRRRLVVTSSPGSCQLLGEVDTPGRDLQ